MRDFLYFLGVLVMVAPIAAVFLFGNHRKGCLPAENDSAPVVYPDQDLQREEARK